MRDAEFWGSTRWLAEAVILGELEEVADGDGTCVNISTALEIRDLARAARLTVRRTRRRPNHPESQSDVTRDVRPRNFPTDRLSYKFS